MSPPAIILAKLSFRHKPAFHSIVQTFMPSSPVDARCRLDKLLDRESGDHGTCDAPRRPLTSTTTTYAVPAAADGRQCNYPNTRPPSPAPLGFRTLQHDCLTHAFDFAGSPGLTDLEMESTRTRISSPTATRSEHAARTQHPDRKVQKPLFVPVHGSGGSQVYISGQSSWAPTPETLPSLSRATTPLTTATTNPCG